MGRELVNPAGPLLHLLPIHRSPPHGAVLVIQTLAVSGVLLLFGMRLSYRKDLLLIYVSAVVAHGLFFRLVYPANLRHVGLLFMLMVCLEWLARSRDVSLRPAPAWALRVSAVLLPVMLSAHALRGGWNTYRDWTRARSSSAAFAGYVKSHPEYHQATIVACPDQMLEALPYYLGNRLYSLREERVVSWTTLLKSPRDTLTLSQLLAAAGRLRRAQGDPVLLLLGFPRILTDSSARVEHTFSNVFSWNPEEWHRLATETEQLAVFDEAAGDENYVVYRVRP
jgi:hypothetical protein